jgi:putative PIN family toxin of toxin-antitoxin system
MRQLIFDTNVLVSGLRSKRGASYRLIRLFDEGRFALNISVALALEYEDVLKRPGLLTEISEEQIDNFLNYLFRASNLEPSIPRLRPRLRDPDDDRILELAAKCGATVVTHNKRDFDGAARLGIEVKTPSEILKILEGKL